MKLKFSLFVLFVFLMVGLNVKAQTPPKALIGTWKMVASKLNGKDNLDRSIDKIKFITPKHFSWVSFTKKNRIIRRSLGGTYVFNGKVYTETVSFVGVGAKELSFLDKKNSFNLVIKGDKMYISGKLSDGQFWSEIWQRMD